MICQGVGAQYTCCTEHCIVYTTYIHIALCTIYSRILILYSVIHRVNELAMKCSEERYVEVKNLYCNSCAIVTTVVQ